MLGSYSQGYQPLDQKTDAHEATATWSQRNPKFRLLLLLLASLAIFMSGMAFEYLSMSRTDENLPHELIWNLELKSSRTAWTKWAGHLKASSPYRGIPSQSIDNAWGRYTDSKWFDGGAVVLGVSREDIGRSWKDTSEEWFNSTVRLDKKNGGGYMATLEIFHQLHCLVHLFS